MRIIIRNLILVLSLSFVQAFTYGQIDVIDTIPVEDLILNNFPGTGVEILNISYQGSRKQFGAFENMNTVLGIGSGIIMSSGEAALASTTLPTGSNSEFNDLDDATSADVITPGDEDLDDIAGNNTFNAAVLEFDFIPNSNLIRFKYVFASEEYPEYNCTDFNDIFAFLLSGPGYPAPENIAKIPGTDFVVSINNINNGTVGSMGGELVNCTDPLGSLNNTDFYVDNIGGMWLEYDGLTIVLEATANVIPCETYHFKLAIADVFDPALESAVFLESQSFSSAGLEVEVVDLTGDSSMVEGCSNINLVFSFEEALTSPLEISYSFSGDAQPGVDFSHNIPTTIQFDEGTQSLEFDIIPLDDNVPETMEEFTLIYQNPICQLLPDTIKMAIYDRGVLEVSPETFNACEYEGQQVQLEARNTTNPHGSFRWTPSNGLSDPNVPNPVASITGDAQYTVTHTFGDCVESKTLTISAIPCFQMYIPNIFSPNGDGINDHFRIFYPDDSDFEFDMKIFDRFGAVVFKETGTNFDLERGWDGSFNGNLASPGVYTYLIEVTINQTSVKANMGSVTLIR